MGPSKGKGSFEEEAGNISVSPVKEPHEKEPPEKKPQKFQYYQLSQTQKIKKVPCENELSTFIASLSCETEGSNRKRTKRRTRKREILSYNLLSINISFRPSYLLFIIIKLSLLLLLIGFPLKGSRIKTVAGHGVRDHKLQGLLEHKLQFKWYDREDNTNTDWDSLLPSSSDFLPLGYRIRDGPNHKQRNTPWSQEATPPLEGGRSKRKISSSQELENYDNDNDNDNTNEHTDTANWFSAPDQVFSFEHLLHTRLPAPGYLMMQSTIGNNNFIVDDNDADQQNPTTSNADSGGAEQGSGFGSLDDDQLSPSPGLSLMIDPASARSPEQIRPTPVFSPDPTTIQSTPSANSISAPPENNRPPQVGQRLPKLVATAGRVWRYFIPFDTFIDEDGDLRNLKSIIVRWKPQPNQTTTQLNNNINDNNKQLAQGDGNSSLESKLISNEILQVSSNSKNNNQDDSIYQLENQLELVGQYDSWLQYDQKAQLLYALPTSAQLGKHELILMASDQFNSISNESLEIHIRQHQSIRAFTHSFSLDHVQIEQTRFPSLIDAVGELVKRVATKLYQDSPFKNMIIRSYEMTQTNNSLMPGNNNQSYYHFDLSWSNGSLAVYPCNLSELDQLARQLVDSRSESMAPGWLGSARNYTPSESLVAAIGSEFVVSSVGVQLHGACELADPNTSSSQSNSYNNNNLRVARKIGKLSWALGEPIEYRIPGNTFELANGSQLTENLAELKLSLHTIDGLSLDKDARYSFLEFDTSERIIYGLAYSLADHVGQRELQLTAENEATGELVREIFVIDIEPQDLTLRGNRAFKVSLYVVARTSSFGPQERVALSKKMMTPFRGSETEVQSLGDSIHIHQFIVLDILKFALDTTTTQATTSSTGQPAAINFASLLQTKTRGPAATNSSSPEDTSNQEDGQFANVKLVRLADEYSNDQSVDRIEIVQDSVPGSGSTLLINRDDQANFLYKFVWTNETIGYQGDCPVELLHQSILSRLEQFMWDQPDEEQQAPADANIEPVESDQDSQSNEMSEQQKFYSRLRHYFEPELTLIHLRFELLGACLDALQTHDVGNAAFADLIDRIGDEDSSSLVSSSFDPASANQSSQDQQDESPSHNNQQQQGLVSSIMRQTPMSSGHSHQLDRSDAALGHLAPVSYYEEYWLVLALVVGLTFVIIMFALGMYTYKKNQDKTFELQVRLAHARQNSMFLSSMVLANQLDPNDVTSQFQLQQQQQQQQNFIGNKSSLNVVQKEDGNSREPVLLDTEKEQLVLANSLSKPTIDGQSTTPIYRPSAVHLTDGSGSFKTMTLLGPGESFASGATGSSALDQCADSGKLISSAWLANQQQLSAAHNQRRQFDSSGSLNQMGRTESCFSNGGPVYAAQSDNPRHFILAHNANSSGYQVAPTSSNYSMTLQHRRPAKQQPTTASIIPMVAAYPVIPGQQHPMPMLMHSQSILTVASLAGAGQPAPNKVILPLAQSVTPTSLHNKQHTIFSGQQANGGLVMPTLASNPRSMVQPQHTLIHGQPHGQAPPVPKVKPPLNGPYSSALASYNGASSSPGSSTLSSSTNSATTTTGHQSVIMNPNFRNS